jgi:outer membrane autotransporter protein
LQSMGGGFDRAFASFSPEAQLATSGNTFVNFRQMTSVLQGHLGDSRARYRYAPDLRAPTGSLTLSGGAAGLGSLQFSSTPLAYAADQSGAHDEMQQVAGDGLHSQAWLLGISANGTNEAVGGYSPFDTDTSGYLLGYDRRIGDGWILGADVGRARTDVTMNAVAARGDVDAWLGSAYATWFDDTRYFEAGLSYGSQSFTGSRVLLVGPVERTADSKHNGSAWTAFVGGGVKFGTERRSLEPYASLSYFNVHEGAFEETGADSMNQLVASRSTEALHGEAGASLSLLQPAGRSLLDWHTSLALGYDFRFGDARITYAYAGAPGTAFAIDDRNSASTSAVFGAGISLLRDRSVLSLEYRGQKSADHEEGFVSARVSLRF